MEPNRFRMTLMIVALLFTLEHALADTVYRWVDENGRTHFSDKPPMHQQPNEDVQTIEMETPQPKLTEGELVSSDEQMPQMELGAFEYEEPNVLLRWDLEMEKITHLAGPPLQEALKNKSFIGITVPLHNRDEVNFYDVKCYASYKSTYVRKGKKETSTFVARAEYAIMEPSDPNPKKSRPVEARTMKPGEHASCQAKIYFPPDGAITFHVRWKLQPNALYSYSMRKDLTIKGY